MADKPRLIILSGAPGVGKSTIAKMYVDEHPMAMNLDIDIVRLMISHWKDYPEESAKQSKKMAEQMAKLHLLAGYDVIIPQIYRHEHYLIALEKVAKETQAQLYEILLDVDKAEAVQRYIAARGGIKPGGLIDRGGGVKKLESMYDEMNNITEKRPGTIKIRAVSGDIDGTYSNLIQALNQSGNTQT